MELEAGDQTAERPPPRGRCMAWLSSELHYTALACCYQDNKAFAFSPVSQLFVWPRALCMSYNNMGWINIVKLFLLSIVAIS